MEVFMALKLSIISRNEYANICELNSFTFHVPFFLLEIKASFNDQHDEKLSIY